MPRHRPVSGRGDGVVDDLLGRIQHENMAINRPALISNISTGSSSRQEPPAGASEGQIQLPAAPPSDSAPTEDIPTAEHE